MIYFKIINYINWYNELSREFIRRLIMDFYKRKQLVFRLRRYFISGLLFWIPIFVTVIVIKFLIDIFDNTLLLLPESYRPDAMIGFHIPGLGLIIILLVILVTGIFVANYLGKKLIRTWDALLSRIPLVRTIHNGVKQILETIISSNGKSFRKVYLVQYPLPGMWTLAFETGDGSSEIELTLASQNLISLFIPMTPNITSGFLIMMDRKDVLELNMSIDQALKFIISLGVVQPASKSQSTPS